MQIGSKDFPLAHLAIAVTNVAESTLLYQALGFSLHAPEVIERENVRLQLVTKGEFHIELLEPFPAGAGPIARFLTKRGPGLHHMALRSDDLASDLAALEKYGVKALPGYPAGGASGSRVAFLDPKTTGGVLIELVHAIAPVP